MGSIVRYTLGNSLGLALLLFTAFMALWCWNGVEYAIRSRGEEIVVRAVLKDDAGDSEARQLAEKLKAQTPGLQVNVISQAQARSMLALQEPWMKNLPEIELGSLPAILEIRHPKTLTSPALVTAYSDSLGQVPQVELVMFNSNGYEGFVRFVRGVRGYAGVLVVSLLGAAVLAYVLFSLLLSARATKPREGALLALFFALVSVVLGGVLAYGSHRLLAHFAVVYYGPLPELPHSWVWCILSGATGLCALLELKDVFRKPAKVREASWRN